MSCKKISEAATPSGRPVKPPIPNIGRKDRANNIGVLKRIDPPQSDKKKAVKTTTEGMDMIIVVSWKKALID